MELPNIGKQCTHKSCNKLDFLPITCDACRQTFCDEHYLYKSHDCPKAYLKDNQVPVCPLCNTPIPVPFGQHPDMVVGAHIDNDCQSDPAKSRRKVFTNKCSNKGCKIKEVVPVICPDCKQNFCFKHRHPQDHQCTGKVSNKSVPSKSLQAALRRQNNSSKDTLSEDEALARALAMSTQEEMDRELAKQLQAMETTSRGRSNVNGRSTGGHGGRCDVQ